MRAPLLISLFNKEFEPQDWLGAPLSVEGTIVHNDDSSVTITVDSDDEQAPIIQAAGAIVRVDYFYDPGDPSARMHLISGPVESDVSGSVGGVTTFTVVDAWGIVMGLIGLPVPGSLLTAQNVEYWTMTGPAETVVKTAVNVNKGRYGIPVTVAADQGRGGVITASVRMHPLRDRLFPAVTQAGVGVSVEARPGGWFLDCYVPQTRTDVLTQASGVVVDGSAKGMPPTVTRAIVGGPGEGVARRFVEVVDDATEDQFGSGIVRPTFVDARDVDESLSLAEQQQQMTDRGLEAIAEGRSTVTVSAELAETEDFRFGVTASLGDTVTVALEGAPTGTGQVTQADVSWTPGEGFLIAPVVGDRLVTFEDLTTAALSRHERKLRDQATRS